MNINKIVKTKGKNKKQKILNYKASQAVEFH